jgi:hypothetical protein
VKSIDELFAFKHSYSKVCEDDSHAPNDLVDFQRCIKKEDVRNNTNYDLEVHQWRYTPSFFILVGEGLANLTSKYK